MDNEKRNKNRSGKISHHRNSFDRTSETKKGYLPETKEVIKNNDDFSLKYLNSHTGSATKRKMNTNSHRQNPLRHGGASKNTSERKINFQREKNRITPALMIIFLKQILNKRKIKKSLY